LGQSSKGDDDEEEEKTKGPVRQRPLRPNQLPDAVFYAILRILPAYKRSIDGRSKNEKQKAWREITAKLRLDPELRRQLDEQAESVLANLDPTVLMNKFNYLKHNAYAALKSRRKEGSPNLLHQIMFQFYPSIREKARAVDKVLQN
jgi:hypothetical protein